MGVLRCSKSKTIWGDNIPKDGTWMLKGTDIYDVFSQLCSTRYFFHISVFEEISVASTPSNYSSCFRNPGCWKTMFTKPNTLLTTIPDNLPQKLLHFCSASRSSSSCIKWAFIRNWLSCGQKLYCKYKTRSLFHKIFETTTLFRLECALVSVTHFVWTAM